MFVSISRTLFKKAIQDFAVLKPIGKNQHSRTTTSNIITRHYSTNHNPIKTNKANRWVSQAENFFLCFVDTSSGRTMGRKRRKDDDTRTVFIYPPIAATVDDPFSFDVHQTSPISKPSPAQAT
jgi:hypothetical protein